MIPTKKTEIRLYGGKIAGWILEDGTGNKEAMSFGGKIVGRYFKSSNITRNGHGQIVAYGDVVSGLLLPPKVRGL